MLPDELQKLLILYTGYSCIKYQSFAREGPGGSGRVREGPKEGPEGGAGGSGALACSLGPGSGLSP